MSSAWATARAATSGSSRSKTHHHAPGGKSGRRDHRASRAHRRITEECFIRETGWRGPFEIECVADGADIVLIEINPRFPAWVGFSAGVGVNLPERLAQRLFGEKAERAC